MNKNPSLTPRALQPWLTATLSVFALLSAGWADAELRLALPLSRTAYQTNERLEFTALRQAAEGLAAGDLALRLEGHDGSRLNFAFPVAAVARQAGGARAVEHLQVNGWLLRPGIYQVEVTYDGAVARTNLEVFSHIRHSNFKLIHWSHATGTSQLPQGEADLGFNLFYGRNDQRDLSNLVRAGIDFMANCVMAGGHQMDLRTECDWSDPYVIRGGTRRVTRRAFMDRTWPNIGGVHFYDEPGLTWGNDPQTGEWVPHSVAWQQRSFTAAFGEPPISYRQVDPADPAQAGRWGDWARWKLGLMDAAWKDAQFGVSQVRSDYVSATQSQYGYGAFCDGYYFTVVRSLPVISGHGGYHDFGPGYFNPVLFLEFARAHDLARPNWYLPTWFGSTTADEFRLEQYLCFQCGLQGLMTPPDIQPEQGAKSKAAQGVVESNHLLGRLGTIFATMPPARPPVALLFSLSQLIHEQTRDRKINYAHETAHGRNLPLAYLAGKLLQHQFMVVLDEDVLDGTLATQHQAIILTSLNYLDPPVVAGLESFIKRGGLVLLTADCTVKIEGALRLPVAPRLPDADKITELIKAGKPKEAAELGKMRYQLRGAMELAQAIRPHLEKAGLKPVFTCNEPGIVATRQAAGDLEYLFAVNATHDPAGDAMLGMKAVTATIGVEADNRPIYDAVQGGVANQFVPKGDRLQAELRFGPGQMRVFARTARPMGAVQLATPVLRRDYTRSESPLSLDLSLGVSDSQGGLLNGSIPLEIKLTDPLGSVRYQIYRATDGGVLRLSLPLAINDPPGQWKLQATELLNRSQATVTFALGAVADCNAAAGRVWRAVHYAPDRTNIFRFFRTHHSITLATGTAAYNQAAAERLAKVLAPWNIQTRIIDASELNHPRPLSADEAATWIGLEYAGRGQIKTGNQNSPAQVGFAVQGPVILLGTPEDNPLIKFLSDQHFLPYTPQAGTMPGPNRGYLAWQRDGLGVEQESITLIAYDAKGLSEAVGTLYEMMAGLEPLTPLALPSRSQITPANQAPSLPEPQINWTVLLPDRIDGIQPSADKLIVLTHDGTVTELNPHGLISARHLAEGAELQRLTREVQPSAEPAALAAAEKRLAPARLIKLVVASPNEGRTAIACWGGLVQIIDRTGALLAGRSFPQDLTALAWLDQRLIVGDADGRLTALSLGH